MKERHKDEKVCDKSDRKTERAARRYKPGKHEEASVQKTQGGAGRKRKKEGKARVAKGKRQTSLRKK